MIGSKNRNNYFYIINLKEEAQYFTTYKIQTLFEIHFTNFEVYYISTIIFQEFNNHLPLTAIQFINVLHAILGQSRIAMIEKLQATLRRIKS